MINDVEDLLDSIKTYVMANLNTTIDAIDTEKADSITLENITADSRHYVIAGDLLELPNHIFVQFAIGENIEMVTNHNDISLRPTITIEICFDDAKVSGTYTRSLRYMRALYETLIEYVTSTNEVDDVKITLGVPMAVTLRGRQIVVSGVSMSVSLG